MASTMDHARSSGSAGKQARVMIWCTPRSLSTVFCKCLSFIPDSEIFCDPYVVAHFTERILEFDFGKVVDHDKDNIDKDDWRRAAWKFVGEEVSDDLINFEMLKFPLIKTMLDNPDPSKSLIISKTTTPTLETKNFRFLPEKSSNYKHSFLLRHPAKLFSSFRKVSHEMMTQVEKGFTKSLEEFDMRCDLPEKYDVNHKIYTELYELWQYIRDNFDPNPVVLETDDLLADPAGMLSKYCKEMGIPYDDSLLTWDESPAITDGWKHGFMPMKDVEAIHLFMRRAIRTTHFIGPPPPTPSIDELTDDVKEYVETAMRLYEEITKYKLKP